MTCDEKKTKRWQFTILHLIVTTTIVAVVAATCPPKSWFIPIVMVAGVVLAAPIPLFGLFLAWSLTRLIDWLFPVDLKDER